MWQKIRLKHDAGSDQKGRGFYAQLPIISTVRSYSPQCLDGNHRTKTSQRYDQQHGKLLGTVIIQPSHPEHQFGDFR